MLYLTILLQDSLLPDQSIISRRPNDYNIMDKRDIFIVIAALVIILVMAVVVKPAVTGEPVELGIPFLPAPATPTPTPSPTPTATAAPAIIINKTPTPTPTTPVATATIWNGSSMNLALSNSLDTPTPQRTYLNDENVYNYNSVPTVAYATINGAASGTTQVINIPYPYWELTYTFVPKGEPGAGADVISGQAVAPGSGKTGDFQLAGSSLFPSFEILVMNGDNPSEVVRDITPSTMMPADQTTSYTEKFYEGKKNYFFVIKAHLISSYTIQINVPKKYIGT